MNPIDKFTNIDAVYPTTDAREEDIIIRLCLGLCPTDTPSRT